MNRQLVESIYHIIQSLSDEERCLRLATQSLLEEKLYANLSYPSQTEIIALAQTSNVFDFLNDEPDLYSLEDGEAV